VIARNNGKNTEVPKWLERGYFRAIRDLAEVGAVEVLGTKNSEEIRTILSTLAISAGARTPAALDAESGGTPLAASLK